MTAFRIPEGSFLKPVDHKIFYSLFENEAIYDIRTRVGKRRSKEIYNLLEPHRKLFGNRALDLACGAGLTSFVLEELGFLRNSRSPTAPAAAPITIVIIM